MNKLRIFGFLLAISLTIGASQVIKTFDSLEPVGTPSSQANSRGIARNIVQCKQALLRDLANPFRWSDLAVAYQAGGNLTDARACYVRAIALSGETPKIWLQAAAFHFDLGEFDQALSLAAGVLQSASEYDDEVFSQFDKILPGDPATVFMSFGTNRRALRAYTQHLVDAGNMKNARLSWRLAKSLHFADDKLTSAYLDAMLHTHRYADAQHDWAEYLGASGGDYPGRNLLFNSGFERDFTGCRMDWRVQASDQFETDRDDSIAHSGKWSIKIKFRGMDMVPYAHLSQTVCVTPGRYTLQAWIRSENIAANDGVRFEIADAEDSNRFLLRTDSITGDSDWRLLTQSFTIPLATELLVVRAVRAPSGKFDQGVVWLDDIRLTRI